MLKIIAITLLLAGQPVTKPEAPEPAAPTVAAENSTAENAAFRQGETGGDRTEQVSAKSSDDDVHILRSGAIGLLLKGGFFMWPIFIMGIIASGVIIERYCLKCTPKRRLRGSSRLSKPSARPAAIWCMFWRNSESE